MAVPDDKPSSIDTPHLFAHIYASHATKVIEEYIATDNKDNISRAKIELDIVRLTHEEEDLPWKHKLSCTSMILHTDTFEPFWGDQKLAYSLSAKSLKRLKPNYRLIDQLPCPSPEEDTTALTALENLTDKKGNSRYQPTTAKNKGKGGRSRAASAKTNGRATKKAATTTATNRKKAPRASKPGAGNDKSNANVNGGTSTTTTASTTARPTGRPRSKTAREAYEACMAKKDDLHLRGPTSDEEETTTDDDSDSE